MRSSIEASEIRALVEKLNQPWRQEYEKDKIRDELDHIEDARRSGEIRVVGENMPDRDEARGLLAGHGSTTVADVFSMWRDLFPSEPPKLIQGLDLLRLPVGETDRLDSALSDGRIPNFVFDGVISHWSQLRSLHPDKIPPHLVTAGDIIYDRFYQTRADTEGIWRRARGQFQHRGRSTDVIPFYEFGKPIDAVTTLLVDYGLAQSDIEQLDRTGREMHF